MLETVLVQTAIDSSAFWCFLHPNGAVHVILTQIIRLMPIHRAFEFPAVEFSLDSRLVSSFTRNALKTEFLCQFWPLRFLMSITLASFYVRVIRPPRPFEL